MHARHHTAETFQKCKLKKSLKSNFMSLNQIDAPVIRSDVNVMKILKWMGVSKLIIAQYKT